jgi:hypothetical protein
MAFAFYVLGWLIGSAILWVLLVIAMFLSQKVADVEFPPIGTFLWKSAVVAGVVNAIAIVMPPMPLFVGPILLGIAFCVAMVVVFQLEFLQAAIIVFVTFVIHMVIFLAILSRFAGA